MSSWTITSGIFFPLALSPTTNIMEKRKNAKYGTWHIAWLFHPHAHWWHTFQQPSLPSPPVTITTTAGTDHPKALPTLTAIIHHSWPEYSPGSPHNLIVTFVWLCINFSMQITESKFPQKKPAHCLLHHPHFILHWSLSHHFSQSS